MLALGVGLAQAANTRSSCQYDRLLRRPVLPNYVRYYRNGSQNANGQQRQSCGFTLIAIEPVGQKKANTKANGNPSSDHQPNFRDTEAYLFMLS